VDDDDELFFIHNGFGTMTEVSAGTVSDGTGSVRLEVTAPGGWTWNVRVVVDEEERAAVEGLVMLGAMAPFSGIDVGIDRGSPVSWARFERDGAGRFTGELTAVTYTPGTSAPDAGDRFVDLLREIGLRYE
jgi:arylsulfatase